MAVFIEIEDVPVHCNLLWSSREAALRAPRGDIRLGFCQICGMIYNLAFEASRVTYAQAYENSLHFSPRFQAYAQELATRLINKYHLQGKKILELGCGQGEFLSTLCAQGGNQGVGFDPSYASGEKRHSTAANITFIGDFYSEAYRQYTADFICCRHVLEHLFQPRDFLLQLRRTLGERRDTVVFFEVPNVLYTLRDLGIWDIIYEHCAYFSAPSLARVFQETGFTVSQVSEVFGDQFLCLEAFPAPADPYRSVAGAENLEQLPALVLAFEEAYQHKVRAWNGTLRCRLDEGRRLVVWGAGSKGVTLVNTIEGGEQIPYVVDINPRKQGKFVAGTGQQIVPPAFLCAYQADTVLVMNPLYTNEIQATLAQLSVEAEILVL
jgi:2-polyprenyl-3-methyl-5-hydroxy-6-metoxy-1,4-benzoquinol methylase